jgi:uncharacterized Zn-binding protein involved in type VI secretion
MSGTGVCRVGDLVTGRCEANDNGHPRDFTGTWITGSEDVQSDGLGVVRVGDTGITDCNHHFVAIEGNEAISANGFNVVTIGDVVHVIEGGVGVTITGSESAIG